MPLFGPTDPELLKKRRGRIQARMGERRFSWFGDELAALAKRQQLTAPGGVGLAPGLAARPELTPGEQFKATTAGTEMHGFASMLAKTTPLQTGIAREEERIRTGYGKALMGQQFPLTTAETKEAELQARYRLPTHGQFRGTPHRARFEAARTPEGRIILSEEQAALVGGEVGQEVPIDFYLHESRKQRALQRAAETGKPQYIPGPYGAPAVIGEMAYPGTYTYDPGDPSKFPTEMEREYKAGQGAALFKMQKRGAEIDRTIRRTLEPGPPTRRAHAMIERLRSEKEELEAESKETLAGMTERERDIYLWRTEGKIPEWFRGQLRAGRKGKPLPAQAVAGRAPGEMFAALAQAGGLPPAGSVAAISAYDKGMTGITSEQALAAYEDAKRRVPGERWLEETEFYQKMRQREQAGILGIDGAKGKKEQPSLYKKYGAGVINGAVDRAETIIFGEWIVKEGEARVSLDPRSPQPLVIYNKTINSLDGGHQIFSNIWRPRGFSQRDIDRIWLSVLARAPEPMQEWLKAHPEHEKLIIMTDATAPTLRPKTPPPPAAPPGPAPEIKPTIEPKPPAGPTKLTREEAERILDEAAGDVEKARQIATQRGLAF